MLSFGGGDGGDPDKKQDDGDGEVGDICVSFVLSHIRYI